MPPVTVPVQVPAQPEHLLLYDGLCGFCDVSVQWILEHDPAGKISFAALQGPTATRLLAEHPELPAGLDSLVYLRPDAPALWYSAAVFAVAAELQGPWRHLRWLGLLPRVLTDLGYRIFARGRYRVWGRRESCRVPSPSERARFLP